MARSAAEATTALTRTANVLSNTITNSAPALTAMPICVLVKAIRKV